MSTQEQPWLEDLRSAVKQGRSPGATVIPGRHPALLDAWTLRVLASPFLAALAIAATLFRKQVSSSAVDPILLLLEALSVAMLVRSVLLLTRWIRRLRADTQAPLHRIAWNQNGLLWTGPHGETSVASGSVLSISRAERAPELLLQDRHAPLHLVLREGPGTHHVSLPPYFGGGSQALETRLTQWWGQAQRARHADHISAATDASVSPEARYADACEGRSGPNTHVVPEGSDWVFRGPYASLLLFVPVLHALFEVDTVTRESLLPWASAALALAVAVPGLWLLRVYLRVRSRRGIAMLLEPEGIVLRSRQGASLLAWDELHGIEVEGRRTWSPFVGATMRWQLVLSSMKYGVVRFDASLLGVPVEVVADMAQQIQRDFRKQATARFEQDAEMTP